MKPGNKPALATLFLVVFMDLVGFGIIIPMLPYVAKTHGAGGLEVGLLFGVYSLMQFFFSPLWGKLSDRIGRRPVLLISLLGSTLSYLGFALADSLPWLFVTRIFAGIFTANVSVASAYIADITTEQNRSKGMGVIGAAFGLGFIFGPVLAGLLSPLGYAVPSYTAAGVSALSLVMAWFFVRESLNPEHAKAGKPVQSFWSDTLRSLRHPVTGALVIVGFLTNTSVSLWETTFGFYLQDSPFFRWELSSFGYMLAYVGIIVASIQGGLIGRLVARCGERKLLLLGLLLFTLSLGAVPFANTLGTMVAAMTLLGIAMGITRPVLSGMVSLSAEAHEQGLVMGVLQGAGSLGRIAGPVLGGVLFDIHHPLPFWLGAALMLAGLGITFGMSTSKDVKC